MKLPTRKLLNDQITAWIIDLSHEEIIALYEITYEETTEDEFTDDEFTVRWNYPIIWNYLRGNYWRSIYCTMKLSTIKLHWIVSVTFIVKIIDGAYKFIINHISLKLVYKLTEIQKMSFCNVFRKYLNTFNLFRNIFWKCI